MNQYCSNCGTRLNGEAFCPRCQRPVAQATPDNNHAPTPPTPHPGEKGGMGKAIRVCFSKYSDFSGRATRPEYWWFVLFGALVGIGLTILSTISAAWAVIRYVIQLAMFLPSYSAMARRLHDAGRSGWLALWTIPGLIISELQGFSATSGIVVPDGFVFSLCILALGSLYLLVVLCNPTEHGPNRFGPEPEPF